MSHQRIVEHFERAFARAPQFETPYRHWEPENILPGDILGALQEIEFPPVELDGVSGSREVHNDQRHYFDRAAIARDEAVAATAAAFQSREGARVIAERFGADIEGTYLRIEYAQDGDGFWLKPHTDIGVKRFTMLLYVSDDPRHGDLGTDVYAAPDKWAKRTRFAPNVALVFVPSDHTWHGFEKRPIAGQRKSVIINYVTDEWRAREQLAYPDEKIRLG